MIFMGDASPFIVTVDVLLPRRCHAGMKERATETAYDPDPICRCLRTRSSHDLISGKKTRCWTSIVLSYPQGLFVHVSLTIYCANIPAASIFKCKLWGLPPPPLSPLDVAHGLY